MNAHMRFDIDYVIRHLPDFGPAILTALELLLLALAIAFAWGILLAIGRLSKGPLRGAAAAYIEFFRNTPLLIQLYFAFFALPSLGIRLDAFETGVAALAAQHSAFFAEIFRGTIQSVASGQREAGYALGMVPGQLMRYVVLPQALRNAVPAMGNQVILLLQDTALVSTIGVYEITLQGRTLAERSAASFEMFVAVGLIYLVLSTIFSLLLRVVEQGCRIVK
ncbi:MAG TPA: amino acid ABC transporter permease [Hyphomicrobiaceae bacterium]